MSLSIKDHLVKRWIIFVVGMFLMGTGIALIIKANMGVSPISSFTTVINELCPPITLGTCSFLLSVFFFVAEIVLKPAIWSPALLFQLVPSAISGVFIDINMLLLDKLAPSNYLFCILFLLLGCMVFGLSLALMVSADVMLMPTEAFISVFAERFHFKWGNVKSSVDFLIVIVSAIICLIAFQSIHFIREGTLISALLIGQFSKLFQRWSDKLFTTPGAPAEALLPNENA